MKDLGLTKINVCDQAIKIFAYESTHTVGALGILYITNPILKVNIDIYNKIKSLVERAIPSSTHFEYIFHDIYFNKNL